MNKMARMEFKVSTNNKDIFEQAAKMMGVSLTEFGIRAMTSFAKKVTTEKNIVKLSLDQQETFFNALANPEKPNNALKTANSFYKKTFSNQEKLNES